MYVTNWKSGNVCIGTNFEVWSGAFNGPWQHPCAPMAALCRQVPWMLALAVLASQHAVFSTCLDFG